MLLIMPLHRRSLPLNHLQTFNLILILLLHHLLLSLLLITNLLCSQRM
jgi:hypothetical protein